MLGSPRADRRRCDGVWRDAKPGGAEGGRAVDSAARGHYTWATHRSVAVPALPDFPTRLAEHHDPRRNVHRSHLVALLLKKRRTAAVP